MAFHYNRRHRHPYKTLSIEPNNSDDQFCTSFTSGPLPSSVSSSLNVFKSFSSSTSSSSSSCPSISTSSCSSSTSSSSRRCSSFFSSQTSWILFVLAFSFLLLSFQANLGQCSADTSEPNQLWWNDLKQQASSNVSAASSSPSSPSSSAESVNPKPNSLQFLSPLEAQIPIASYSIGQSPLGLSSSIYTPSEETLPFSSSGPSGSSSLTSPASGSSSVSSAAVVDSPIESKQSSLQLSPSDDELMTQASRLNSKMTRIAQKTQTNGPSPVVYRRAAVSASNPKPVATKFDDSTSSADDIFGPESDAVDQESDFEPETPSTGAKNNHVPAASSRNPAFSQFAPFQGQEPNHNRIWTYFDTAFNNNGGNTRNQRPSNNNNNQQSSRDWRSKQGNQQQQQFRSKQAPADPDAITRQFRQTRPKDSARPSSSSNAKNDKSVLNFNFNRRKNPEEKEKWRQLIQSIFDSTPRSSENGAGGGYGNGGGGGGRGGSGRNGNGGYSYKSKTKTTLMEGQTGSGGIVGNDNGAVGDNRPDALEDELGENNLNKDMESEEVSGLGSKEEEMVNPNSSEVRRDIDEDEEGDNPMNGEGVADDSEGELEDNNGGDGDGDDERSERDERADGLDGDEDDDEDDIDDEANQYVRKNKPNQITGQTKRHSNGDGQEQDKFGSRINRSSSAGHGRVNKTSTASRGQTKPTTSRPNKPNFTMRFSMNNQELFNTNNVNGNKKRSSSDRQSTTPSSVTTESGFRRQTGDDENDDDDEELTQQSTTPPTFETFTSTPASFNFVDRLDDDHDEEEDDDQDQDQDEENDLLRISNGTSGTESPEFVPKLKRKQQRMGKWMDIETFELKDDNKELDGNDLDSDKSSESVLAADNQFLSKMITKKKALLPPPRTIRQNSRSDLGGGGDDDDEDDDSIARLARTLPGTPGEDYSIFGHIPRTDFDCRDHKWPGYYADIETKCQVFHICQQGGRKNSFLCPNGTMFNQQLFVCDWWHNVQCDEVAQFYDLNEMIYDHNWESKRQSATASAVVDNKKNKPSRVRPIRRIGSVSQDSSNTGSQKRVRSIPLSKSKSGEQFPTTVPTPTTEFGPSAFFSRSQQQLETTTTSSASFSGEPLSLTESVFGNRPNKKTDKRLKNSSGTTTPVTPSSAAANNNNNSDKNKESLQLDQGLLLSTALKDQNRSIKMKRFLSSTKGGVADFRFSRLTDRSVSSSSSSSSSASSSSSSSKKESPFLTRYKFVSGQTFKRQAVAPDSSSSSPESTSSSKSQPKPSIASILSSSRLQAAASANSPTATAHIQAAPSYLTGAFRHRGKYYRT